MSEATEQVPSAETIRELQQALRELLIGQRNTATVVHEHEEEVLPRFVRLTDIANTISPQLSSITGWPPKVMRSLRAVIEGLHALTLDWGWEKIGLGEPFRTQHIEERKAWFRENVERPMYVAAVSWEEHCITPICPVQADADFGRVLKYKPTMGLAEAKAAYPEARRLFGVSPRLGKRAPQITDLTFESLEESLQVLTNILPVESEGKSRGNQGPHAEITEFVRAEKVQELRERAGVLETWFTTAKADAIKSEVTQIRSHAGDLLEFLRAIRRDSLIPVTSQQEMQVGLTVRELANLLRSLEGSGLPLAVRRGIKDLDRILHDLIERWRWEHIIGEGGDAFLKVANDRWENRRQLFLAGVLSYAEAHLKGIVEQELGLYFNYAVDAEREGIPPSDPPVLKTAELDSLFKQWNRVPYLADQFPTFQDGDILSLESAIGDISDEAQGNAQDTRESHHLDIVIPIQQGLPDTEAHPAPTRSPNETEIPCSVDQPGYLGLIIDEERAVLRRNGMPHAVRFTQKIQWDLLRILVRRGDRLSELKDLAPAWEDQDRDADPANLSRRFYEINKRIKIFSIRARTLPKMGSKLEEIPENIKPNKRRKKGE